MTEDLRDILRVLAPYLPDIVIIGGWVPELHRRHGTATWRTTPARTTARGLAGPPARPGTFPADWVSADTETTVVEFLMARPGPAMSDSPRQVDMQGYLGAILIDDAEVLSAFTCELVVRSDEDQWTVRVPTLGAWAIGKALTFSARQIPLDRTPNDDKRAKDLLYLRDLIHAGPDVLQQLERDLAMLVGVPHGRRIADRAVERLVAPADIIVDHAARRLAERDGRAVAVARVEIVGAMQEISEMIRSGDP
ncbi:MAG: hypothetical protein IPJ78_06010 [Gemmatimonadetes bacterium]|nr:hypothetical protein [Gemmatimonadota bacterium]